MARCRSSCHRLNAQKSGWFQGNLKIRFFKAEFLPFHRTGVPTTPRRKAVGEQLSCCQGSSQSPLPYHCQLCLLLTLALCGQMPDRFIGRSCNSCGNISFVLLSSLILRQMRLFKPVIYCTLVLGLLQLSNMVSVDGLLYQRPGTQLWLLVLTNCQTKSDQRSPLISSRDLHWYFPEQDTQRGIILEHTPRRSFTLAFLQFMAELSSDSMHSALWIDD